MGSCGATGCEALVSGDIANEAMQMVVISTIRLLFFMLPLSHEKYRGNPASSPARRKMNDGTPLPLLSISELAFGICNCTDA
jgi:hypothetical protein